MGLYEIAFHGQCLPGTRLDVVKASVGQLFKADAKRVELLFSGRRLILKSHLDALAAERFRLAMERAGAVADIVPMEALQQIDLASPPMPQPGVHVVPRDVYMAAFVNVDAPAYGLAEPGATLQEHILAATPPQLDLSRLSLAPAGADIGSTVRPAAPPAPDTSHLKLVP
jgi:hypothetical protein